MQDYLIKNGFGLAMPRSYLGGLIMTGPEYNAYIKFINIDLDKSGESYMFEEMTELIHIEDFLAHDLTEQLSALQRILNFHKIAYY